MDPLWGLRVKMSRFTQFSPREVCSLRIFQGSIDSQKQLDYLEVTYFLFNCMRMWTLGSTESQPNKLMKQSSQEPFERTPPQRNPTNTPQHSLQSSSLWTVLEEGQISPFDPSFLVPASSFSQSQAHYSQKSTTILPLSQDKQQQICSMLNYLPKSYPRLYDTLTTTPNPLLSLILSSLPPQHPIITKFSNFFPQHSASCHTDEICRKKLHLCFSNKWRQCQCQIYISLHYFPKINKQQSLVRVHLLNHRGLLLQTVVNLAYENLLSDLVLIIKKHYRKAERLIFLREINEIDIDFIREVKAVFEGYNIDLVIVKQRTSLDKFGDSSQVEAFRVQSDHNLFGYLFEEEKIAVITTRSSLLGVRNRLKVVAGIIEREMKIARYLFNQDYFSLVFNRKEILLRLFAFYFNSLTLEHMQPFNKEDFLDKITTSELSNLKKIENNTLLRKQPVNSHAVSIHECSLSCFLCKKRTKTICQKCCITHNSFFGLCRSICFEKYHHEMEEGFDGLKNEAQREEQNQEQSHFDSDAEMSELSSRTRKRIKRLELLMDDDEESENFQEIQQKWAETMKSEKEDYEALVRYTTIGLLPESIIKKVDYLNICLKELSSNAKPFLNRIKQEENQPT